MSRILNEKKRIVKIANNTVLPELNCIKGPITRAKLTTPVIIKMVRNGRTLFEIDPEGKRPMVKLDMHNCTTSPFEKSEDEEPKKNSGAVKAEPVKTEAPTESSVETAESVVENTNPYQNYGKKNKHNKHNQQKYQVQQNQAEVKEEVKEEVTEEPSTEQPISEADI